MKIIPLNLPLSENIETPIAAGIEIHRRIEVTLEREIVSVLVRGQPPSAGPTAELPQPIPLMVEKPERNGP